MAKNKIDRYGLGPRVLELHGSGRTTTDIAGELSLYLENAGIEDSVDQSTVSRWLSPVKKEMQEELDRMQKTAEIAIKRAIDGGVQGDLEDLLEVRNFLMDVLKNQIPGKDFDVKSRMMAGSYLIKMVETKWRLPGVMDGWNDGLDGSDGESAVPSGSNVYSLLERIKRNVSGGARPRLT